VRNDFFKTSVQVALKLKCCKIATIIIKHVRFLLQAFCGGCGLMCDGRGVMEIFIDLTEYR